MAHLMSFHLLCFHNLGGEATHFASKVIPIEIPISQAISWIDVIPLEKWSKTFDDGRRYDHMTTNLVECMNSVLKGARSLPICALIKKIFERVKD